MKNMETITYISLLRGINVGGKNIINMTELSLCYEELNFSSVKTYIQSGNIIFKSSEKNKLLIKQEIENKLSEKFASTITTTILSVEELNEVIYKKPVYFGEDLENFKYDIIFLIAPLSVQDAQKEIQIREGIDYVYFGKNVIYISRNKNLLTKSYLPKIIKSKIYNNITIRSWNTIKNLYENVNS